MHSPSARQGSAPRAGAPVLPSMVTTSDSSGPHPNDLGDGSASGNHLPTMGRYPTSKERVNGAVARGCATGYREESDTFAGSTAIPMSSVEQWSEPESGNIEQTTTWKDALRISYAYTIADVRRRPRNTLIGIFATFVLVFFSGLILIGIWKAPYVLLRLAELSAGEMDVVLYGGNTTPVINFTEVNNRTLRSPDVRGSAPRWIIRAELRSQAAVDADARRNQSEEAPPVPATTCNMIIMDTELEPQVGIGRAWPYRPIGYGEAQVYQAAADFVNVRGNRGERISLEVNITGVSERFGIASDALQFNVSRPRNITDPVSFYLNMFFIMNNITEDSVNVFDVGEGAFQATMVDAIGNPNGKYSSVFGNAVILDVKPLIKALVQESCVFGSQMIKPKNGFYFPTFADILGIDSSRVENFDMQGSAMIMITTLADRYTMYYSETAKRNMLMTKKTNSLMEEVGLDFDGNIEYPVAEAMEAFDAFRILLVSSFIMVVACVVFFGGLLLFALVRINADERQFELGMIRAQGMPQRQVVGILITQTVACAIPGTILGVICVFGANALFEIALERFTHAPARPTNLPLVLSVISASLGLIVPLFAVRPAVRAALQGSLRDALDVYRQSDSESRVVAQRLEEMGLATWQIVLGVFLLLVGFMVYYCMPLSFIFRILILFFILLEIILIIMIVGLCMMLHVLETYAESVVLYLLLWGSERKLKTLIVKNLRSHRDRNAKAYLMFLLCIGCVVAAGVMFSVLSTISGQIAALNAGASVTVTSSSFDHPLAQEDLDAFLSGAGAEYIVGSAYSSFPLSSYPQIVGNTRIASLIGTSSNLGVVAISRSFMDAVYPEYTIVGDYNTRYSYGLSAYGKRDVVRSMYDEPATLGIPSDTDGDIVATGLPTHLPALNVTAKEAFVIPMLIASASKPELGLAADTGATLSYSYMLGDRSTVGTLFYLQPRALMRRVSGFIAISTLRLLFRSGSILIPDTHFKRLLNPIDLDFEDPSSVTMRAGAVTEIRQRVLYVQLKEKSSKQTRERFVNALQAHTDTLWHTTVDTQNILDELMTIQNVIIYFFYFTAAVGIVLCAFMLWLTFISNVQLNAWTFGVLRSLGFRNAQLVRASIYEALSVVISAFVLGMSAGMLVGVTMAVQFTGYLVLPFRFNPPYPLMVIVAGMALISALIAPALPIIKMGKSSIAGILKGG